MYTINTTTGTPTYIGLLGPGFEMDGMGIPAPDIPVELSSFTADVSGVNVSLSWITATETNNSGFEVQRAKSEGDFEAAKTLVETYGVKVDKELHKEVKERFAGLNITYDSLEAYNSRNP